MKKLNFIIPLLLLPIAMHGQQDTIVSMSANLTNSVVEKTITQSLDTSRKWDFHLTMGTTFLGGGLGSASVFHVSPSIVYRPTERLTVKARVSGFSSYAFGEAGHYFRPRPQRSMVPYRDGNAVAGAIELSASYKVSDRLWVAASLYHVGGEVATGAVISPWLASPMPMPLDATAISASLRYRVGDNSFLDIHFTHIDDRAGTLAPLLFETYRWHYGSPFNNFYF